MAVKTNITSSKENKELTEEQKAEIEKITPGEYFEMVKNMKREEDSETIKQLKDVCIAKMKKFVVTNQKKAAKDMFARVKALDKELQLINRGFKTFIYRTDIEEYIDNIADDCVVCIELSNYEREIPDDIVDKIIATQDIFDEYFIVFTDYTGEKRKKVAKEKRDKDPILFGNIFVDGLVSNKFYFIGDWIDEFCDLTFDKMIQEIAKNEKTDIDKITQELPENLEELEEILFGTESLKMERVSREKAQETYNKRVSSLIPGSTKAKSSKGKTTKNRTVKGK